MAQGGARTNSGPAPDPNALRRARAKDDGEWLTLPASGRDGDTPEWPLDGYTAREAVVWARLWRTPQAVAWERNGNELEVAMFVRRMVQAEEPKSSSNNATLVRQMMDSLGLTNPGMRSNRWRLSQDELETHRLSREPLPQNNAKRRSGRIKRVASNE